MTIKKTISCLLILMLLLSTGCATNTHKKLVLSEVTHSVFYAPQYAAMALGYFEDEGIEIELVNGGGADNVMTAVLSGGADIGFAGPESVIYVINEGKKNHPKAFAQVTKRDGAFLLSREKKESFSYSDLEGKTLIGGRVGGVPLMTLMYVVKEKGISPDSLIIDTSIDFNNMTAAFASGIGDYVTAFEPTASMFENEGAGYIVASVGKDSGEIPYTAYFCSNKMLKEDKETLVAFTRAIYKAQKWVGNASSEEIAKVISPYFADTDTELLIKSVESYKSIDAWSSCPIMEEESLNKLMDVIENAGELSARPNYDEVFDLSIAKEAMKD